MTEKDFRRRFMLSQIYPPLFFMPKKSAYYTNIIFQTWIWRGLDVVNERTLMDEQYEQLYNPARWLILDYPEEKFVHHEVGMENYEYQYNKCPNGKARFKVIASSMVPYEVRMEIKFRNNPEIKKYVYPIDGREEFIYKYLYVKNRWDFAVTVPSSVETVTAKIFFRFKFARIEMQFCELSDYSPLGIIYRPKPQTDSGTWVVDGTVEATGPRRGSKQTLYIDGDPILWGESIPWDDIYEKPIYISTSGYAFRMTASKGTSDASTDSRPGGYYWGSEKYEMYYTHTTANYYTDRTEFNINNELQNNAYVNPMLKIGLGYGWSNDPLGIPFLYHNYHEIQQRGEGYFAPATWERDIRKNNIQYQFPLIYAHFMPDRLPENKYFTENPIITCWNNRYSVEGSQKWFGTYGNGVSIYFGDYDGKEQYIFHGTVYSPNAWGANYFVDGESDQRTRYDQLKYTFHQIGNNDFSKFGEIGVFYTIVNGAVFTTSGLSVLSIVDQNSGTSIYMGAQNYRNKKNWIYLHPYEANGGTRAYEYMNPSTIVSYGPDNAMEQTQVKKVWPFLFPYVDTETWKKYMDHIPWLEKST